ncbi:MAG: hypothetical protein QXS54_00285 [Candidatus Methanomethylicaceae archaeon]
MWKPFSNGSQFADWKENNCKKCTKGYDSEMMNPIKTINEIRYLCGSLRCYLLGHDMRWHEDGVYGVYCERCGMPEGFSAPVLGIPWMIKERIWLIRVKILSHIYGGKHERY